MDIEIKKSTKPVKYNDAMADLEARLNLVERQLKDYVPDHWLFQEDEEPNNTEEEEPEPVTLRTDKDQLEFDFGSFLETKH